MIYFTHNQAPLTHKPVVGEINTFGENHPVLYGTSVNHIYVIDYWFMGQRDLIDSKINRIIVFEYLIIFLGCKQEYGMTIAVERALSQL